MKKALAAFLLSLAFALTPALSHAEMQLGVAAMDNAAIASLWYQPLNITWGMESRLTFLNVLQVGLTGLYYTPSVAGGPSYILALADAGLSVEVFFLRFGIGLGPDLLIPMSGPSVDSTSNANLKLSGDIDIGPVSLGAVAFYPVLSVWDLRNLGVMRPWVGMTAMLRLF